MKKTDYEKNKKQSQEIHTTVGIKAEKNSSFYNEFIVPLKSNRKLSPLVQNILEAYYSDEDLRKHIDSVIEYNNVSEKTKRRINEIASELKQSAVTAKVLHSILTSEQADSYVSIDFNKENPFDTVGIIDHMKNMLPTEIKEKTELFLGQRVYQLENQVEELQQKLHEVDDVSSKHIKTNSKSYSEVHPNDSINVDITNIDNAKTYEKYETISKNYNIDTINKNNSIAKNNTAIINESYTNTITSENDTDIISENDNTDIINEDKNTDIISEDDNTDIINEDKDTDIIIDDGNTDIENESNEDIIIDDDIIIENNTPSSNEEHSVPVGFSKISKSANIKMR
ncbi:TPA: hypothetical protein ACG3QY_001704 [Clostridioides difficile]